MITVLGNRSVANRWGRNYIFGFADMNKIYLYVQMEVMLFGVVG
jgi:hypothetical protein